MRASTALPELQLLEIGKLVLHEECDRRRVDLLCQRLGADGLLKHPPVVAAIPDSEQFVVLDGANRTMAFQVLGIPHIVAQVVSYGDPGVELGTWHHIVAGMPLAEFETAIDSLSGLRVVACSLEEARAALATGAAAAYIVCQTGVRRVSNADGTDLRDIRLLNRLVSVYAGRADISRASNDVWDKQAPYYRGMIAIIVFPSYSPGDILLLVRRGERVPTGITRHVIPNRALHIDIALDVLRADWPLDRKREWLAQWLRQQVSSNAIRYYAEPTFLFGQ